MIAIHKSDIGFYPRWVSYCEQNGIPFKVVDCHRTDIISQLNGCKVLLWHHWQVNYKDLLKAKRVLFALEHAGIKVFPNFKSSWHFDDKIAQKYLLEALGLPLVNSYHFVDKSEALEWASKTSFPKVFKLKGGAGSANVRLVHNKTQALSLINKTFSNGFSGYDRTGALVERFEKFKQGKDTILGVFKSLYRIFNPPMYAKMMGRLKYEIYFQDFIPGNDSDIRVIVVGNKAFAIKRIVRKNDFRASGSGNILYEKSLFSDSLIKKSFEWSKILGAQVVAFDFVFLNGESLIVEISYGYAIQGYDKCEGYWDDNLNFYPGTFDSTQWIIDDILKGL
jgi:glutathione synthase/RimK-type ligase-like ATP-grasp enzyme